VRQFSVRSLFYRVVSRRMDNSQQWTVVPSGQ
jgi:hypothetical protein